jgi:hypothetical protein
MEILNALFGAIRDVLSIFSEVAIIFLTIHVMKFDVFSIDEEEKP